MNEKIVEAYDYFKLMHTSRCIFFRINNECRAYFDDAKIIHEALNIPLINDFVSFAYEDIFDVMCQLGDRGIGGVIVSQRNDVGKYAIPDVAQIKIDSEMDY